MRVATDSWHERRSKSSSQGRTVRFLQGIYEKKSFFVKKNMLQYVKERFTNILPVGPEKGAGEEEVRNVVPPSCLKRYAKSAK